MLLTLFHTLFAKAGGTLYLVTLQSLNQNDKALQPASDRIAVHGKSSMMRITEQREPLFLIMIPFVEPL